MLVLSRKINERIQIGDEITITVVRISDGNVRIGINAPSHLLILRDELAKESTRPPDLERDKAEKVNLAQFFNALAPQRDRFGSVFCMVWPRPGEETPESPQTPNDSDYTRRQQNPALVRRIAMAGSALRLPPL